MNNEDLEFKKSSLDLIEKIYKFKDEKCEGLTLMETILEFSFKFDIPITEIGNTISYHPEFVLMLEKQFKRECFIKDEYDEVIQEFNEEEW